jgi:hypothetical protein
MTGSAFQIGCSSLTLFCFATAFTNDITSQLAAESSPLVGSSKKRSLGPVRSWLATDTRRFCPPLMPFRIGVPIMVLA